tara:strand:- start:1495 stop:1842 length:348 start_codon:yes stop_codon:yes gene_type:complete
MKRIITTKEFTSEGHSYEAVDFGVTEQTKTYGTRSVGARVLFREAVYAKAEAAGIWQGGYKHDLGHVFVMFTQTTRNGEDFQANHESEFATAEKRETAKVKYFANAKKRAIKKFG